MPKIHYGNDFVIREVVKQGLVCDVHGGVTLICSTDDYPRNNQISCLKFEAPEIGCPVE